MRGKGGGSTGKEASREVVGGRAIREEGCSDRDCDQDRWIRIVSDQLYLPEALFDVEEDGEAVEIGLKDLMWFLFFGMPGDKERAVCDELREREEREARCDVEVKVFVYLSRIVYQSR